MLQTNGKVFRFLAITAFCLLVLILMPSRSLALGTYTISVGERVTVRWSASYVTNPTQAVWLVSGSQIKKISSDLRSCTVEGMSAGTGSVTVTVYYMVQSGSYYYSMSTTDAFTIKVETPQPTSVALNHNTLSLREGRSATLFPTLTPSNASTSYTWSSSNHYVASVSSEGNVYANHMGLATITVTTANGKSDSCQISVLDPLATMVSSSPANLAESVSVNAKPSVTFSAELSAGPSFQSIQLMRESDTVEVEGTKTISGNQVVFSPSATLEPATRYRLVIPSQAVVNTYGTLNTSETMISFVTTPFLSIIAVPSEKQEDVATDATIQIIFDQMIKPGASFSGIKLAAGSTNVAIHTSITGKTLFITADVLLTQLTYYTLTLPANALSHENGVSYAQLYTLHFTTAIAAGTFAGGNGSAEDPYLIATEEHLRHLGDQLDRHYQLTADITLTQSWQRVGTASTPFTGVLDGNNHTILNFRSSDLTHGGVFGVLSNATVQNIKIVRPKNNSPLQINSDTTSQGILAEKAIHSAVTGCAVSGGISAQHAYYLGGLVGYAENTVFRNCATYANVNAYMLTTVRVGGLVGYAKNCTFNDCLAKGSVYYNSSGAASGYSSSSSCAFTMSGFVGEAIGGSANNCSSGAVIDIYYSTGYPLAYGYFGGLIGHADAIAVNRCSFNGSIDLHESGTSVISSTRYLYTGGLIGRSVNNTVKDADVSADIDIQGLYYATVTAYAGGLVGFAGDVTVTRCAVAGKLFSFIQPTYMYAYATHYVGGLVGYLYGSSTCQDSYTRMETYGRTTAGADANRCTMKLGHFAGYASGSLMRCYAANQCYRVDFVDLVNFVLTNQICNYFVGQANGVAGTVCYACAKESSDSCVTLLTDAQMRQTESYVGWDFNGVWGIDINTNNGYPFLNPPISGVAATGCEQTFDALPHQIAVTVPVGASVAYSIDGSAFSDVNPSFTMTPAPVTVFYRVTLVDKSMTGFATINLLPIMTGLTMDTTTLNVGVGLHYRMPVTLTSATPELAGVIWSSSDPDILDFDTDGWLVAKKAGTVLATCTAWDGSGLTMSRTIHVHEKVAVQMSPFMKEIKARAFANCDFDEMNLLACENLLSIGSGAFAGCENLNVVYIGDSVTSIAADAFSGCTLLYIHCFEGSAAYDFAVANGIQYVLLQK